MAAPAELIARVRRHARRLAGPPRIPGIDLARGLAVLGMLAAHLYSLPEVVWSDPETWVGIPGGRSSILFATLAGVSISLVTGGVTPLARDARPRYRRWLVYRALVLWLLGIALILTGVPVYVILPAYAVLFLVSTLFLGQRAPTLAAWAVGIALLVPWVLPVLSGSPLWETAPGEALALLIGWAYPAPLWLAFLLAGMAIGRLELSRIGILLALAGGGIAVAVVAEALAAIFPADEGTYLAEVWTAGPHSGGLLEVWGSGGFVIALVALCVLVCRVPLIRALAVPLRAVGSMPLTAYSVQLLIWAGWSLAVFGTTDALWAFLELDPFPTIAVVIVLGCCAWAFTLGRGPLERVVDRISRPALDRLER